MSIEASEIATVLFPGCWKEVCRSLHRVIPANSKVLETVLAIVGTPSGVFGEPPPYHRDGSPYVEPEDSKVIEDFKLWADSRNQPDVKNLGAIEKLTGFTMVIDANTPEAVLRSLYAVAKAYCGYFRYEDFIIHVPFWAEQMGWIYVPLAGEHDLALFVVSHKNRHLIDRLDQTLGSAASKAMQVVEIDKQPCLEVIGQ
jgi:hypothetical protein